MPKRSTILTKITWLTCGQMTSHILAFLFYAVLARVFGESEIGKYAFAFALASFFGFGIQLGLRPLVTREVAKNPKHAPKYLGNLVVMQTALCIAAGVLLHLLSILMDYSYELYSILVMAFLSTALKAVGQSFAACLEAIEAMEKSALLELTERVTILVLGFMLIFADVKIQTVMIAHVTGAVAYSVLAIYWTRKHFGEISFEIDAALIKTTLLAALPFLGASALNVMYARVDVLMLHHLIGSTETGAYAVAFRCIETSLIAALMAGLAIYPSLSRFSEEGLEKRNELFVSALKWLGILGVAGAAMLITVGDSVLTLIMGQKFSLSGELIRYMSVVFLIGCVKVPYWRLLFATNHEYVQLRLQGLAVTANVLLNILLIPRYGALGAVWASIISEVILVSLFHWYCTKCLVRLHLMRSIKLMLAAIGSIVVGLAMRSFLPWPFVGISTIAAFCGSVVLVGFFTTEEQVNMAQAFRRIARRWSAPTS